MQNVKTLDWVLYILVFVLASLGVLIIYTISYGESNQYLFWNQLVFFFLGLGVMVAFTFIDYRAFKSFSWTLYFFGLLLLVLVLFIGKQSGGSVRWIDLKFFQLQPSEIFKLILIIVLANFLSSRSENFRFKDFFCTLVIIAIPTILVLIQPDFGTALVLVIIGLVMLIVSGIDKIYFFILTILGAISSPLIWFFVLKDYQKQRLVTFLNPQADPFGEGYSVLQSIIATGSGMITGRGLGGGVQSQLKFLPVPHSDFIFAVFSEQMGFIGGLIILGLFLFLVLKIIKIAKIASDRFGYLISIGVLSLILFQLLVNIGMNIGMMPVTGIPLPFVSYGGTALIIVFILVGILQSMIIRQKKMQF